MIAQAQLRSMFAAAEDANRAPARLVVGAGGCGRARGAEDVLAALRDEIAARSTAVDVVAGGCNGMCFAQVVVEAARPNGLRLTWSRITPESVPRLLDAALAVTESASAEDEPGWLISPSADGELTRASESEFLVPQKRLLLRDMGVLDPSNIDDYVQRGGYATLARALDELAPEEVIAEVKLSGLLGRGGAYFPTALKWQSCRSERGGQEKWLVVNAEEGEPGVYKDRHLLEGEPHRAIEGMLLAAYAIAASRGVFYINGEARLAQASVHRALEATRTHGLIGDRILGTEFSFHVEVRHGAGGYILGEETALLESIEGRRAMPRVRPPFPVERGLWGRPTVINNVETLANVRAILEMGGKAYSEIGQGASGTKLIGLSGNVARPGLVEVPFGATMRQIVEGCGGGVPGGHRLEAVLIGGPSGVFVPAAALDEPMQPRGVVPPGTGGWVVLDDRQSILDSVRQLTQFNMAESCGKCTPCREGTVRMVDLLDRVADRTASAAELAQLRELCDVVETASLCGLGQMAPRPITSALEHFRDEFGLVAS